MRQPGLKLAIIACVMAVSTLAHAIHPISSKLEFVGAYPVYKDIWAYLRAIPPVERRNQGNTLPFPLDVRLAQCGWELLFFYPNHGYFAERAEFSRAWNRGAYLVEGLGHCSMCHTPLNLLGSTKKKYYLTGAFIDRYWAPDITKRGLETATRFEMAGVFDEGKLINKAGPVRGPMADVINDSLCYLTKEDRPAIAEYLKSVVTRQPRNIPKIKNAQPLLKRGSPPVDRLAQASELQSWN